MRTPQRPGSRWRNTRNSLGFSESAEAAGRTLDQKRALYRALAEKLAKNPGLRKEDILVNLVEVPKENWSFGNGEASYAKE